MATPWQCWFYCRVCPIGMVAGSKRYMFHQTPIVYTATGVHNIKHLLNKKTAAHYHCLCLEVSDTGSMDS